MRAVRWTVPSNFPAGQLSQESGAGHILGSAGRERFRSPARARHTIWGSSPRQWSRRPGGCCATWNLKTVEDTADVHSRPAAPRQETGWDSEASGRPTLARACASPATQNGEGMARPSPLLPFQLRAISWAEPSRSQHSADGESGTCF